MASTTKKGAASAAAPARNRSPRPTANARQEFVLDEPEDAKDQLAPELVPEVGGGDGLLDDDLMTEWDGRSTPIKLSRGALRDNRLAGPGLRCIDCGSAKHHFHLRASKDAAGTWLGPEAIHAQDLIASGIVADTQASRSRDVQQAAIEVERGVHAPPELDAEGKVVRRPFPELAELTMRDHLLQWRRVLDGGPEAVVARERAERREAVGELEKFAGALRKAIFGDLNPEDLFTGAARARQVDGVAMAAAPKGPDTSPGVDLPGREADA